MPKITACNYSLVLTLMPGLASEEEEGKNRAILNLDEISRSFSVDLATDLDVKSDFFCPNC